jgi:Rieske Fe-S protein
MTTRSRPDPLSRRRVLGGATAVGLGGSLLSACGGEGGAQTESSSQDQSDASSGPTIRCGCHGSSFSGVDGEVLGGPAPEGLAAAAVTVKGKDIEVDGEVIGSTAEVPEGAGAVFKEQKVVVTQPEAGEFKAFTAVCTHQGCVVQSVEPG